MNESNLFDTARSAYHRISEENQKQLELERARQKRKEEEKTAAEIEDIKLQIPKSAKLWDDYAKNQKYGFDVCWVKSPKMNSSSTFGHLKYFKVITEELSKYGVPFANIHLGSYNADIQSYSVVVNFAKSE